MVNCLASEMYNNLIPGGKLQNTVVIQEDEFVQVIEDG
jgi:hypothetical protein